MDYAGCPDENPLGEWVRYEEIADVATRDRIHEARVAIAQRLLDETERARREENALNSAHPVTADRFSRVMESD
jgi:hypothetical protein